MNNKVEPSLPDLTSETWELIEFRMWKKFQAKLWAATGILLAIISLGTALGMDAYVKNEVKNIMHKDRDKFVKTTNELILDVELYAYVSNMERQYRQRLDYFLGENWYSMDFVSNPDTTISGKLITDMQNVLHRLVVRKDQFMILDRYLNQTFAREVHNRKYTDLESNSLSREQRLTITALREREKWASLALLKKGLSLALLKNAMVDDYQSFNLYSRYENHLMLRFKKIGASYGINETIISAVLDEDAKEEFKNAKAYLKHIKLTDEK